MGAFQPRRFVQLDGLRGVAAFIVLLNHYVQTVPERVRRSAGLHDLATLDTWLSPWPWIRFTPVRVLFNGQAAVIMFFVLSGFVLSLPVRQEPESYASFICKRFCRIYLPFCAAILLAAAGWSAILMPAASAGGDWAARFHAASGQLNVVGHLLMTGQGDAMTLDPVMWTLVHEMRVSFLLPVIFMAMRQLGSVPVVVACLAASVIASPWLGDSISGTWTATLHFLWAFVVGAAVSFGRDAWARRVRSAASWVVPAAWGGIILVFTPSPDRVWWDFPVVVAAAGAIILLLPAGRVVTGLSGSACRWLGRVSYSLSLIHFPILAMAIATGLPLVDLPALLIVTLCAAEAFHRLVEMPAHRLGRRVAAGLDRTSADTITAAPGV